MKRRLTRKGAMHGRQLAALVAAALALGACAGSPEGRGTLPEGWLTRNRDAKGPIEVPAYAWPQEETHPLQLPGTNLAIDVHDSYFQEEIQDEERRLYQVASYASTDYAVDFDIYLIPKTEAESLAGLTRSLVDGARDGRDDTHVTEGIEAYTYLSEIAFDGLVYDTITLVTADESAYVRVVFWLEGNQDEAMAYARQMIASLKWVWEASADEDVDAIVDEEAEALSDAVVEDGSEDVTGTEPEDVAEPESVPGAIPEDASDAMPDTESDTSAVV